MARKARDSEIIRERKREQAPSGGYGKTRLPCPLILKGNEVGAGRKGDPPEKTLKAGGTGTRTE